MDTTFSESLYPLDFRLAETKNLGEHLRLRHSVELVGIKHVGISNFLNFFLHHEKIVKNFVDGGEKHMFVAVDLNDLVEREVFAFWVLTFKRLVDRTESFPLDSETKKNISTLFLNSIQSRNFFLTYENLREAMQLIVKNNILPTIFFIRFDRLRDIVSEEFLANLVGLRDSTAQKLAYVFTSFRSLDQIVPEVFSRKTLSVFSHVMYVKCATDDDMQVIFEIFEKRYGLSPTKGVLAKLIEICGGHVQYLQISLIILNQKLAKGQKIDENRLFRMITSDERVNLISEEIWESLSLSEQEIVKKVYEKKQIERSDREAGEYLWETGLFDERSGQIKIFSPLFSYYLTFLEKRADREGTYDLTKKENSLFNFLFENLGEICERDQIIEKVWPEYEDLGISDWTVDQLVARLRTKLKKQNSAYEVVTVRTRGYRLVEES